MAEVLQQVKKRIIILDDKDSNRALLKKIILSAKKAGQDDTERLEVHDFASYDNELRVLINNSLDEARKGIVRVLVFSDFFLKDGETSEQFLDALIHLKRTNLLLSDEEVKVVVTSAQDGVAEIFEGRADFVPNFDYVKGINFPLISTAISAFLRK